MAAIFFGARVSTAGVTVMEQSPPPDEVPEVADAVGARALGLRRVAEQLRDAGGPAGHELAGALRAHAGDVDALAEHLRDAGGGDAPPAAETPP